LIKIDDYSNYSKLIQRKLPIFNQLLSIIQLFELGYIVAYITVYVWAL